MRVRHAAPATSPSASSATPSPVPGGHGPAAAVASLDGKPYRMVRAESLRRQPFPVNICIHGEAADGRGAPPWLSL